LSGIINKIVPYLLQNMTFKQIYLLTSFCLLTITCKAQLTVTSIDSIATTIDTMKNTNQMIVDGYIQTKYKNVIKKLFYNKHRQGYTEVYSYSKKAKKLFTVVHQQSSFSQKFYFFNRELILITSEHYDEQPKQVNKYYFKGDSLLYKKEFNHPEKSPMNLYKQGQRYIIGFEETLKIGLIR